MKLKLRTLTDNKTIDEAFEEFIQEKQALNKSASTIKNYAQSYRMFCEYHKLKNCDLNDIDKGMVYQFANSKKDGARVSSVQHYMRDLRAFFYWCMDREYMPRYKIEIVGGQEPLPKDFTDEECVALLEKPERTNPYVGDWRCWLATNWALGLGSRIGTILEVKMGDIDLKNKTVMIRTTKNNKPQILTLVPPLASAIGEYIKVVRYDASDNDYLFCGIDGEQLTYNGFKKSFQRYCEKRGVEHSNFHGLRHTFAKSAIIQGMNEFALSKILGHTTLAMTNKYVKLYGGDLDKQLTEASPLASLKGKTKREKKIMK